MKDPFGREITYLRISVTDLCNLRCVYCMPAEGVAKLSHKDILSVEEIEEIARAAAELGITKIRVTGGEPLVRKGIIEICRRISSAPGISEVCLTTNGTLLPQFAPQLRAAGIKRLNISLDSLDPETYRAITRGGELADALRGIEAARSAGFGAIKINAVLLGGVNDSEIRELAELSRDSNTHVRFIELMPIGATETGIWRYIPGDAVLSAIPELEPLGTDGVTRLFALPGACGTVGLISPRSRHFCPSCNRIRVTSDGKLKPCLHSPDEIDLRVKCPAGALRGGDLKAIISEAVMKKPQGHSLDTGASGSLRDMNKIGG